MTTTMPPVEILTRVDASACVTLAKSCGWADELSDWRPLFAASEVLGVRADDGSLLATCVRTSYGAVTTIGKMVVHASARGRGLARALVEQTVASANGSIVSLVATDMGLPVYQRLGFSTVGEVVVLQGRLAGDGPPLPGGVTLGSLDLDRAIALDRKLLSCDRGAMLRARAIEVVHAWCAFRGTELLGYVMATSQPDRRVVGPVIASDASLGAPLVHAVAGMTDIRVDIPAFHWTLVERLTSRGLVVVARRAEMTLGGVPLPLAGPGRLALASQAFG